VDDFSLAEELVRDAGTLASSMLNDGLETHYKTSVSDVVSAADHAAEELVVGRLRAMRPADGLVGEEGSTSPGDGRTWYVDPVDGTYNFLSGVPYWCSAVGLVDRDGPAVGAVYYPAVDELWIGGPDRGTTLNGVPVTALVDRSLASVSIATYLHPRHLGERQRVASWQAAISRAATVRMLGSASVDLAGVASSRLGIFLQANLKPWDWFPGAALVLGAGGVAETLTVGATTWQIAGNRQSVAEIKAALQESASVG
jgi:myo-inositol-1(or 4)-monophosphatase